MMSYRFMKVSICLALLLSVSSSGLEIQDWPTAYITEDMTEMDVLMTVGYYIQVMDQNPIHVSQDVTSADPYRTYEGCKTTDIQSNFWAQLIVEAAAVSLAGGHWSATVEPDYVTPGISTVEICVRGENVQIEKLFGGAQNIKVAEIVVKVLPL
jgi:hypothetical protein